LRDFGEGLVTESVVLYVNNNGMTCCIDHGGSYLRSAYEGAPERKSYVTPLDCWERIDEEYMHEWATVVGALPMCEMCI
jgi:hypothetical protein